MIVQMSSVVNVVGLYVWLTCELAIPNSFIKQIISCDLHLNKTMQQHICHGGKTCVLQHFGLSRSILHSDRVCHLSHVLLIVSNNPGRNTSEL